MRRAAVALLLFLTVLMGGARAHTAGSTGFAVVTVHGQTVRYVLTLTAEVMQAVRTAPTGDFDFLAEMVAQHIAVGANDTACAAAPGSVQPPSADAADHRCHDRLCLRRAAPDVVADRQCVRCAWPRPPHSGHRPMAGGPRAAAVRAGSPAGPPRARRRGDGNTRERIGAKQPDCLLPPRRRAYPDRIRPHPVPVRADPARRAARVPCSASSLPSPSRTASRSHSPSSAWSSSRRRSSSR